MTTTPAGKTRIAVSPDRPTLDTLLQIQVLDAPADERVVLRARSTDQRGARWSSWAAFITPDSGVLDLSSTPPVDGRYRGVDPMGLIWSMTRDAEVDHPPASGLSPIPLLLTAEFDSRVIATKRVDRLRLPDGITRIEVRTQGLVGTLFLPEGGPHPGVLLLGGSEGGLHEDDAALLAAHGFAVLALAYFGTPGVPTYLVRVPVEYFGTALCYLADHELVRADRLAVIGGSFGGQAALLIGATYAEIRAVVSVAGSGVVTQGIDGDTAESDFLHILRSEVPPWTWRGRPLPFIADPPTPELVRQVDAGEPVAMRLAFKEGMRDRERLAAATIPVERIQGAVLLISAGDDRNWPAEELSDIALHRLAAHQHPFAYCHVRYPKAGHGICTPPFRPTTETAVPGPGVELDLGGTPADTAAAQRSAWAHTIDFLTTQLA